MRKNFIMPILVLSLICLVVTGALAMMNSVTQPVIEAAASERAYASMAEKISHATGFERIYAEGLPRSIRSVYRTTNDVGFIFIISVNGFSGEIRVICGVDPDGNIISSSALQHTETRGIGTILDQSSFTVQFDGKDSRLEGVYAVSGATISTQAYINAIRDALKAFELVGTSSVGQ